MEDKMKGKATKSNPKYKELHQGNKKTKGPNRPST